MTPSRSGGVRAAIGGDKAGEQPQSQVKSHSPVHAVHKVTTQQASLSDATLATLSKDQICQTQQAGVLGPPSRSHKRRGDRQQRGHDHKDHGEDRAAWHTGELRILLIYLTVP